MKVFIKILKVLALLLVLWFVQLILVGWWVRHHKQNRPEYVLLEIPGQAYRLPVKKYNMWVHPYSAKTDQAAFGFSLILPDLAPSTTDPAEAAQWGTGTGWHRELHVFMQYEDAELISQQQMADEDFQQSDYFRRASILHPPIKPEKYLDPKKYTVLTNGCREYEGIFDEGQLLFECGTGDSMWVTTCELDVPSPVCQSVIKFDNKMQLNYFYGFDFVNRNVEIHDGLLKLLNSFRVPDQRRSLPDAAGDSVRIDESTNHGR